MVEIYKIDFMKGIVILVNLVNVDEIYNILISGNLVYWSRDEDVLDDPRFCWSLPLNIHTFITPLLY